MPPGSADLQLFEQGRTRAAISSRIGRTCSTLSPGRVGQLPYQAALAGEHHQVVEHGAVRGLAIEGLGSYALRDHVRGPALVIGYTTPPEHAYTRALARLTAAFQDQ